jgi:3-dehydroquinate synthase
MSSLSVSSSTGSYEISINSSFEPIKIQEKHLADKSVLSHLLTDSVGIYIEGSEENKQLSKCENILVEMNDLGLTRSDNLLAIGGGSIQDIATLVSSLYMRGISWTYMPTTLMAMMDSCIGGKSAINARDRKNLVGNFYPPKSVAINTKFIETLTQSDLINGLSEAVKICFAHSKANFNKFLEQGSSLIPGNNESTAELIHLSLESKRWFVEIDEFDKKERQRLNFGHTFAHALESATNYKIPHGTAVAIGIIAACRHPRSFRSRESELLVNYCSDLMDRNSEVIRLGSQNFDENVFQKSVLRDKKNTNNDIALVLPSKMNQLEVLFVPKNSFELDLITTLLTGVLQGER